MLRCIICRMIAPLDDAEIPTAGVCICRRCWRRILGQLPPVLPSEYDAMDPAQLVLH